MRSAISMSAGMRTATWVSGRKQPYRSTASLQTETGLTLNVVDQITLLGRVYNRAELTLNEEAGDESLSCQSFRTLIGLRFWAR